MKLFGSGARSGHGSVEPLGYFAPKKVKILGLNGPGGAWEADPGYQFVLVVVRLPDHDPHLRCSSTDDALVLPDGQTVSPVGFSMGKVFTDGLDTVFWAPTAHFEFSGTHEKILYGLLFALPVDTTVFKVSLRRGAPVSISPLATLPSDLGSSEGSLSVRESMSVPRFLPLAHRIDPPTGLRRCSTPRGASGVMERGVVGDHTIFIVRAALAPSAAKYQVMAQDIRAQLVDDSWIQALGLIDWLDLDDAPSVPSILDNASYSSQGLSINPGCTCTFLHEYRGPITARSEHEVKLAIAFSSDVATAIHTIEVGNDRFVVPHLPEVTSEVSDFDLYKLLGDQPIRFNVAAMFEFTRKAVGGTIRLIDLYFENGVVLRNVRIAMDRMISIPRAYKSVPIKTVGVADLERHRAAPPMTADWQDT